MKKSLTFALLLLTLVAGAAYGQCVPDPGATSPGFYPLPTAPLPNGAVGVPYSQVITINVPADTTVDLSALIGFPFPPITATVVQQEIGVVNGLPIGYFASPNPLSGVILGGASGCLDVSGTTNTSGQYVFNIPTDLTVTIPQQVPVIGGTNQVIPVPVAYNLEVTGGVAVNPASANGFTASQSLPNPTRGNTVIRYTVTASSDVQLDVIDVAGKVVLHQVQKGVSGANSFRFDASAFAPGLYLYRLNDGTSSIVKKMVVE